jgi:hypothetical protein
MGFFSTKQKQWDKRDKSRFPINRDDTIKDTAGIYYDVLKDLFYRVYDLEKKLDPTIYTITKMNRITPYADEKPFVLYWCTSCDARVAIPRLNAPDYIQCVKGECQGR